MDFNLSTIRADVQAGQHSLSGRGRNVMGNPLHAVSWLVEQLSRQNNRIEQAQNSRDPQCIERIERIECGVGVLVRPPTPDLDLISPGALRLVEPAVPPRPVLRNLPSVRAYECAPSKSPI